MRRFNSAWRPARSGARTVPWFSASTPSRRRPVGRRSRSTFWPRSTSARREFRHVLRPCARNPCRPGCAVGSPTRPRWQSCRRTSATAARPALPRSSIGWQVRGPIGAGRAATSPARTIRVRSTTSCATCWRRRWRRPTPRNGSTPVCTGPTASMVRRRATSMSTRPPARSTRRRPPMSARSPTPASSRACRTISSTRAGSWTCGSARPACSSTARVPAPISPACAAKASACPAAAAARD